MLHKDAFDMTKPPLCQVTNVKGSLVFLNQKSDTSWHQSCCPHHESFILYVLESLLSELNEPGQRKPHRKLDLVQAIKRLSVIFREDKVAYTPTTVFSIKEFIRRYIHDPTPVIAYAVIDVFDNFIQSVVPEGTSPGNDLCLYFFEKITKFTIRALLVYMKDTLEELISDEVWNDLYDLIGHTDVTSAVTELIVFHSSKMIAERDCLGIHLSEILRILLDGDTEQRRAVQAKLLPRMFKSVEIRNMFNKESPRLLDVHDDLYASAPHIRAVEVVLLMTKFFVLDSSSTCESWFDCIDVQIIAEALTCEHTELRMLAWQLICENPRLTRPFSYDELLLARCFITSNMTEQQPGIRQTIVHEFKMMMARMRESYKLLRRMLLPEQVELFEELSHSTLFPEKTSSETEEPLNEVILKRYVEFLRFLHDFLFSSLQNGSNFNRKLMALLMLECLHESSACYRNGDSDIMYQELGLGDWLGESEYYALVRVLDDEYEINQGTAERILAKFAFGVHMDGNQFASLLDSKNSVYKSRCYWRKIQSEGVERLLQFLRQIQHEIEAECKAIRHRFQYLDGEIKLPNLLVSWNAFFEAEMLQDCDINVWMHYIPKTMIPLCLEVAKLVSPVVHSLAPEGYYPVDFSNDNADDGKDRAKKAQQLLVNSWRTHKEVSCVFNNVLKFVGLNNSGKPLSSIRMALLPPEVLQQLIKYLWIQMTECRHCGAFEMAGYCFNTLCSVLWRLKTATNLPYDYSRVDTPDVMLDRLLRSLQGLETELGLCETRRSAGLPPLMCAILVTEPKKNNHAMLSKAMSTMFGQWKQHPTMIIHTINCLVALFECSELAEVTKQFLSPAFLLCFREPPESKANQVSFTEHWPIRNTVSRLFSAIIRRMFGSPKRPQKSFFVSDRCTKSSNEVFVQLPVLYKTMLELLTEYVSIANPSPRYEFHLYPLLTMLTHITPSHSPEYPLSTFHPLLVRILSRSHGQKVRELAAVALIMTTQEVEFVKIIGLLTTDIMLEVIRHSNNAIDGVFQLMVVSTAKHDNVIPPLINNAFEKLFTKLFKTIDLRSLSDIALYHFFLCAQRFADSYVLPAVVQFGMELLKEGFFEEHRMSLSGFVALLVVHQQEWKKHEKELPLNFRYDCYRLAEDIDEELLPQLFEDFAQATNDDDLHASLQPLVWNHELLNESLLPVMEKHLKSEKLHSDLRSQLMDCFVAILSKRELSDDQIALINAYFEEASNSYESDIRYGAIRSWLRIADSHRNSQFYEDCMSRALMWLQDSNSEVRNIVAQYMNEYLLSTELSLNASILWNIALKTRPEVLQQLFPEDKNRPDVKATFSTTALNPFAENITLPMVDEMEGVIAVIERYKAQRRVDATVATEDP